MRKVDELVERCPFCWSSSISYVSSLAGRCADADVKMLRECRDCEKWFRADSGDEVPRLFEICATPFMDPARCDEDIRTILYSGGVDFPRRRAAEFNRLCTDCRHSRFLSEAPANVLHLS